MYMFQNRKSFSFCNHLNQQNDLKTDKCERSSEKKRKKNKKKFVNHSFKQ